MAAALGVKAATVVRFFLAIFGLWRRLEVRVLLRADQEVPVTLVLREAQARRKQGALLERSPVDSHATVGGVEWASRTLGELLPTVKHATDTKVGGRLDADHPMISWTGRRCCWLHEVLRNNSFRGRLGLFWRNRFGTSFRDEDVAWLVQSDLT